MQLQIIQQRIFEIRGQKVIPDFDLSVMYGVEYRAHKQAVKGILDRYPDDFMFPLTKDE